MGAATTGRGADEVPPPRRRRFRTAGTEDPVLSDSVILKYEVRNSDCYVKSLHLSMLQLTDICMHNYVGQTKHIRGLDPAHRLVSDLCDQSNGF